MAERFHKKRGRKPSFFYELSISTERVKQEIGKEAIPLNQDSCSECEPDGCNNRCSGEKFLHRSKMLLSVEVLKRVSEERR